MQKLFSTLVALGLLGLAGLMSAAPARAQAGETVSATVGGEAITMADVRAAQAMLPEQIRTAPLDQVYDIILGILIDSKLAARDAVRRGLDKDVDVTRQLARVREQILERAALTRRIDQQITDAMINERHQKIVALTQGQQEMRVSHILLKTREDAESVIAELKTGTDFAALAKTRSTGPSGPMGGDIGFIAPGDTVAPFETAAFALDTGAFTDAPVQTQFGWHVILAGEKRDKVPPALETVRDGIVGSLSREIGLAYIQSLREGVDIKRFGMDGKPQN